MIIRILWLLFLSILIAGCSGNGGSGFNYKPDLNEGSYISGEVSQGFIDTAERMASNLMTHYIIANANKPPVIILNNINNHSNASFDLKAYKEKMVNILNSKSEGKAKFIGTMGAEKVDFSLSAFISNTVIDKTDGDLHYYVFSLKLISISMGNTVWGDDKEFSRTELNKKR